MDISERIAQLREEKNIRKADMARILDMDASHYNKFEKRGKKLTVEQVEQIAQALGVSVAELLTGEPQTIESKEVATLEAKIKSMEVDQLRLSFYERGRLGLHNRIIMDVINFAFEQKIVKVFLKEYPFYEVSYLVDKQDIINNYIASNQYETFFEILKSSGLLEDALLLERWAFYRNYIPQKFKTDVLKAQKE